MIKDHYLKVDLDTILTHALNVTNAHGELVKSIETADPDRAKNAMFQMDQSMKVIFGYNDKKKKRDLARVNESMRYHW